MDPWSRGHRHAINYVHGNNAGIKARTRNRNCASTQETSLISLEHSIHSLDIYLLIWYLYVPDLVEQTTIIYSLCSPWVGSYSIRVVYLPPMIKDTQMNKEYSTCISPYIQGIYSFVLTNKASTIMPLLQMLKEC